MPTLPGALCALLASFAFFAVGASPPDPGIELRLDRSRFEIEARDLRDGAQGPRLRVALGSPGHPTPSGAWALERVILNPGWTPGPRARAAGARPEPPSTRTPMGAAKIPFSREGAYALHGGAIPLVLGKPVSSGCIRALDDALLDLIDWLGEQDALLDEAEALADAPAGPAEAAERHRRFRRPVRLYTR